MTASHTYNPSLSIRPYIVTLTVRSANGWQDSTSQVVTVVKRANTPPDPSFTYQPPSPQSLESVSFTSTSSDSDGFIYQYEWDFGDGQSSTSATPTNTFAHAGTYDVKLTVTDDAGQDITLSKYVTISNTKPAASFTSAVTPNPNAKSTVFLTSTSYDPDGTITVRPSLVCPFGNCGWHVWIDHSEVLEA
jgi:PKD repeat protein